MKGDEMIRLSTDRMLTPEMVVKYIEKNRAEVARRQKLYNYYLGKHDILKRSMADATKPNNKIVHPYAKYITNLMTGYFMGDPVKYKSEDAAFIEILTDLYNYNDEAAENSQLAKDASIFGEAYEMLYLDENTDIRFCKLDPTNCIPIYDNTIEGELLYFIRYYDEEDIVSGNTTTFVEVFSRTYRQLFSMTLGAITLIEEQEHSWRAVPIIIYQNNEEQQGDFEAVLTLIDAYDKADSDSINELEYFGDAYLALYGMMGTEASDIAAMKEQRVILMEKEAKAEWLVKDINDAYIENLKNRLDDGIHKFSTCPAMTDTDFASNASGVAMKYKLMGLENTTSNKERAFKKALQRRVEIICNMLSVMGTNYDYRAIEMAFSRNIPANLTEVADVLNKVGDLLSTETKLSMLPLDIDIEQELARKEEEKQAGYVDFAAVAADQAEVNANEPVLESANTGE